MDSNDDLARAIQLHRAGRLADAEPLYRSVLSQSPGRHDVQYLLALLLYQLRNDPEAIDLLQRAIGGHPDDPEYYCNLGVMLASQQRFDEALAAYRKALELNPRSGEAYNNLGNALLHQGQMNEAAEACRRAAELMPESVLAHYNLGNALAHVGQPEEAVKEYRRATELNPKFPEAFSNLASVLNQLRRYREAIEAARAALTLRPNYAAAHNNVAGGLLGLGQLQESIAAAQKAVELQPNYPEALINLGSALLELSRWDETISLYRQAITLRPDYAPFHGTLAVALLQAERPDEAMIAVQRALVLDPNLPGAHDNHGSILREMGRIPEAVEAFGRAIQLDPTARVTHDNLVLTAHYDPAFDAMKLRKEAEKWASSFAEPLCSSIEAHANSREPDRPLRIGYVSPDFREHTLGRVLLPLIRGHDRKQFKVFCYCNAPRRDAMTEKFQACADVWRDIYGVADERVAAEIRDDRIDILVDLAAHTAGNRLLLFERKPAPVQVTYLAYPGTSGLKTVDYRLSDPYLDPPESDPAAYTERTIRLPHSYWIYEPQGPAPEISPPPSIAAGYVTFGCMNNTAKISEPAIALWAELLGRVANSRIVIHSTSNDHQQTVIGLFSKRGVVSSRIEFIPNAPWFRFMETMNRIDIALDPFPFGGGITTCDTLWMGVPVVTLRGQTAVGRGGCSVLSNVGLPELIARSTDEYVEIAAALASNPNHLTELRWTMRGRMKASPIMNTAAFVTDVEAAYRQMWRDWCQRPQ